MRVKTVTTSGIGVVCGLLFFALGASPTSAATPCPVADVAKDLASPDKATRLKAGRVLRQAACYAAAVPVAALITDPDDDVQLEGIAGEVAIFLNKNATPKRRVGYLVTVRHDVASDAFWAGPMLAGTGRPAPPEVLAALRTAAHDDNPRVAVEALYAFGAISSEWKGTRRQELQAANGTYLAELVASPQVEIRMAAAAVIGRLYSRWPGEPLDESVGPAMVKALGDADDTVKIVAARGIGAMRYEPALQPLTDLFNERVKGDVAEGALDALARIAHPSSLELFKSQLTSPEPGLRAIAVAGIGRSRIDRLMLIEMIDTLGFERSDDVLLSMNFAWTMVENMTVDPLGEALLSPTRHDIALAYLIEIAALRSAKFFAYAHDPDPRLRADVADILGVTRDPRGLPLVQPMLKDKNPVVVQAAERAIARMQ